MNWKRGIKRLYIVITIIFMIFLATFSTSKVKTSEEIDCRDPRHSLNININEECENNNDRVCSNFISSCLGVGSLPETADRYLKDILHDFALVYISHLGIYFLGSLAIVIVFVISRWIYFGFKK